jgi:hypothetical protein
MGRLNYRSMDEIEGITSTNSQKKKAPQTNMAKL